MKNGRKYFSITIVRSEDGDLTGYWLLESNLSTHLISRFDAEEIVVY